MNTYKDQYRVGLLGEMKAEIYLRKNGVHILSRRFRYGKGEVDLIGREGECTVFYEVKYRPEGQLGDGLRAVDPEKVRNLRSAANGYLKLHPASPIRFDVIEITKSGIRHMKNAF